MIMENEGDFYVELEHHKKRGLAIINLYVKDEMISHNCWDHQINNYVPNSNKDHFKQKKLSLSILMGTNFTYDYLEDGRFLSLGFLNN